MDKRDEALARLLSEPVEPDGRVRSGWIAWVIGVVSVAALIVVGFVVFGGDESVSGPATSAAATSLDAAPTTVADEGGADESPATTVFAYPPARIFAGAVADPGRESVVLLGGKPEWIAQPFLATWLRDGSGAWTSISPTLEPPGRSLPALAYVDSIDRVLLIGGDPGTRNWCSTWSYVGNPVVDVWSLDVGTGSWEQIEGSITPPDRWAHAVAYVPGVDRVVLFGGLSTEVAATGRVELLSDLWLLDPSAGTWEQVDSVGPDPRGCHKLIHHPTTGLVYLWGGLTDRTASDPTLWAFDAESATWTEVLVEGDQPEARWSHQMVYEPTSGLMFLIGGTWYQTLAAEGGTSTELLPSAGVWAFDVVAGAWVQRASMPGPHSTHTAVADGLGHILVFNGPGTLVYDVAEDVWTDATPYEQLDLEQEG